MLKTLRNAALGLGLAANAVAALPAAASADDLYFGIGNRGAAVGIYSGPGGERFRHRDRSGWDRPHAGDWRYGGYRAARCTPDRALFKAERLGLHRAWVRDVDWRTISVSGRRFGERRTITFARAPSCPVIGW